MIRLALRVRRAQAERVLAELLELAPAGVEEVDRGEVVEYAVYGAPGELPELPALRAAAQGALVEVATSEVADDWPERWREFHRPVRFRERLYVRPLDLRRQAPPSATTTAANLAGPLLRQLAPRLSARRLLVSGVLVAEADDVAAGFAARGLTERERRVEGDWTALLLEAGYY